MNVQDNNAVIKDAGKLRKKIRKAIVKILKNNTDAGPRVFPNASVPLWVKELPAILIYPRSESASMFSQAPKELERDLNISIEIVAVGPETDTEGNPPQGKKSLEDILDDIAERVECLMNADDTLQGTADDSIYQNTEFEFESAGERPIGSAIITYGVTYYTMAPRSIDKQGELPDFKTSQQDWHIGDVDEKTREAKDTVDIPTT